MGRRSISSTKTGKFMNPTDQARKEARRKELKKNKKQRQIVRHAVLKGKDPKQIIVEMEALDKMEFDPNNPPPYNVKVLQDKRKKLKETWVKLFRLYENDDPKYFSELRGMELEYEKKKSQMVAIYESVKKAEKVKLEDIPLPDAPSNLAAIALMQTCDIPLPPPSTQSIISAPPVLNQKGILKKSTEKDPNRKPPGPPPGPPPPLSEFECDDDEKELGITVDENIKNKAKKLRFADDSSKSEPISVAATINALKSQMNQPLAAAASIAPPPPMPGYPPMRPPGLLQSQMGGYRTAFPPPPVPSSISSMQQRLAAQSVLQQQAVSRQAALLSQQQQQQQQTSYSAPATTSRAPQPVDDRTTSKIIEAKPVLRNKMAEITRFVPTSLMVKRDQKQTTRSNVDYGYVPQTSSNLPTYPFSSSAASSTDNKQGSTTDIAYDQFMKEINKLL